MSHAPLSTPRAPRDLAERVALLLAEWFGAGRSPIAPGTVGALATIPLYLLIRQLPGPLYFGLVALLTVVGIWASEWASRILGDGDPSRVVIDEVLGVLIALGFVRGAGWPYEALAWLAFRLFDITKPGLIDKAQYLEPPGVGIMADDVLAGLLAGLVALAAFTVWGG